MGEMVDAGNLPVKLIDAINTMRYLYAERSMLYGSLIQIMIMNNIPEIEIPYEDAKYIGEHYFVKLVPNEVQEIITATLMEHEKSEEEDK